LHQGAIALGEIDLSKYSKVIIKVGVDNSQVTMDHHAANAHNRIMLTSVDTHMTNSPADENVIAYVDYTPMGWAVQAIEIDLTGVDYNGPVFATYDTLPGTFMLFAEVEFIGAEKPEEPIGPEAPVADNVTIDFSTKDQRTEYSTSIQVWENGDFVITNNKAGSKSNVGDYANPARFYASSELIFAYPGMTKIVIDANDGKPVEGWVECINDSNATVTQDGNIVTVEFTTPVDSFTVTVGAQVRANAITAYAEKAEPEVPAGEIYYVTTTDTYGFFDEYTFTATVSGTYTFTLPAGLSLYSKAAYDAWDAPEVDLYANDNGGATVTFDLAAGASYVFYVGATTKADWEIVWTVEEKEIGGGDEPEDPDTPVEPAEDISGTYTATAQYQGTGTVVINAVEGTLVFTDSKGNVTEYGLSIEEDGSVVLSNQNGPIAPNMALYFGGIELGADGMPAVFYNNGYEYTLFAGAPIEPDEPDVPVGDNVLNVGANTIVITDEIIASGGVEYTLVVEAEGQYTFDGDFFAQVLNGMGIPVGTGSAYLSEGTYTVNLGTMQISAAGEYTLTVLYEAPGEPEEPDVPVVPGNPAIEALPFTYEVGAEGLDMDGVYFDYTATEAVTLVITKPAGAYVSLTATNNWEEIDGHYELLVNAGETITLNFWSMSGISEGTFTVSLKA
ncbi:MAG: hypothetical protein J6D87_00040, partial [Clostridia bacterium]|nr:hypothetical protein [Clostridia bacterium]